MTGCNGKLLYKGKEYKVTWPNPLSRKKTLFQNIMLTLDRLCVMAIILVSFLIFLMLALAIEGVL